jgi:hypothetical protein
MIKISILANVKSTTEKAVEAGLNHETTLARNKTDNP